VRRGGPEHSSRVFEAELCELDARLLAMGGRCERIVSVAFEGFLQGCPEALCKTSMRDEEIDGDELAIQSLILRVLALRQPVADDLRFLATAFRLSTTLERIGDEAVNIAERATPDDGAARLFICEELGLMAGDAFDMLHLALDSFARWDQDQAEGVLKRDPAVDRRAAWILDAMTGWIGEHPDGASSGLRAIRVARHLERIADGATQIAEQAVYIIRGEDVRHGTWRPLKAAVQPLKQAG
jgi:phosphate transport system protein